MPADQSKGPLTRIKGQGYVHSYFRPNNGKEIYEIYERASNYSKTPAELLTLIKSAKFYLLKFIFLHSFLHFIFTTTVISGRRGDTGVAHQMLYQNNICPIGK